MKLDALIDSLPRDLVLQVQSDSHAPEITAIAADSREVGPGSLFVALAGEHVDGHDFILQAVAQGAAAVVIEREVPAPGPGVQLIRVADTHLALGLLAAALHDYPARKMVLIGLTGTNGKTTTSWLMEAMLTHQGYRVGVIGTVNYRYPDAHGEQVLREALLTTPDPVQLQGLLAEMAAAGVSHVIMEVSSHALVQKRVAGLRFQVAVFTNLSRDHLDFHGDMESYFAAKKMLFTRYLAPDGVAVITMDKAEGWGRRLYAELRAVCGRQMVGQKQTSGGQRLLACGFTADCHLRGRIEQQGVTGSRLVMECVEDRRCVEDSRCVEDRRHETTRVMLDTPLTGTYNMANLLSSAGVGLALGLDFKQVAAGLGTVGQVPGRLERVSLTGGYPDLFPTVFVDYAHTPDALASVLAALRPLARGRLVCVFGCGGDRDQGKRPEMGRIAARLADTVVVTSDNPRTENPAVILAGIEEGIRETGLARYSASELFSRQRGYTLVEDRKKAIKLACSLAESEDVVLVAGKGHESCQVIGPAGQPGSRRFFDDRLEAQNGLMTWNPRLVCAATGGHLLSPDPGPRMFVRVCTDSRAIRPGDIFVALVGESFDGHAYIPEAVEKGAACVVVSRDCRETGVATVRVKDTLQALGDLAGFRRRLAGRQCTVAAITGSSGKTTVKEMTGSIFSRHLEPPWKVLKTRGNFNNLIGLPLSLLPLQATHRLAVLEMGMNRPGEIERLTGIADPDIGCITNVQAAHLEGLGSLDGVREAKGELFAAMRADGVCVINYDNPHTRRLARRAGKHQIGFAVTPAGRKYNPVVRATRVANLGEKGIRFTLHIGPWKERINVAAPGLHNVSNCCCAAAIAHAAGIAPETIVEGLVVYRPQDKRMQVCRLPGGIQVVNDAYNANPASMAAALETVSSFGSKDCRRVAALGDMLELGPGARQAHHEVGLRVAELGFDLLVVTGQFADTVAEGARTGGMDPAQVQVFADTDTMAGWLHALVICGRLTGEDWILVKGSRGMRMEQVIKGLKDRLSLRPDRPS
ncbi:UDP-N-acetylmuramoyl-L-alanyl-D-glutamate--2,6-diaminopimelate ligase [Desulfolithobacter sp.]